MLGVYAYNQTTWTGAINNDWHTTGNWDTNIVPNATSNVIIPSTDITNYPIITNNNANVASLQLGDYATTQLTINNGKTLTIEKDGFSIKQYSKLYLDSGTVNYYGNTAINIDNNTDILIELINHSTLYSPYTNTYLNSATLTINKSIFYYNALLNVNGNLNADDANINVNSGLIIASGWTTNLNSGSINIRGDVKIDGVLNGGISNIIFDGSTSTNYLNVRNGGQFFMDKINGTCSNDLESPPPTSVGSINFKIPSTIENNGLLDIGDAEVTFHQDLETQGDATILVWNGILVLESNGTFGNTSILEIECRGSISILGNGTFQQSGDIIVGDGSLSIGGNAVFANTGTLTADDGDITFTGDVIIANAGGTIDAGSSEITFEGGTIQNDGTFEADSSTFIFAGNGEQTITGNEIEFYELVVSDSTTIVSSVDISVVNDLTIEGDGDVLFEGDASLSTLFPYIVASTVITKNKILVEFNQAVNKVSAQDTSNYLISKSGTTKNILMATQSSTNLNEITLQLGFSLYCGATYGLSIENVVNDEGQKVKDLYKKNGKFSLPDFNALVRNITESPDSTLAAPFANATTCPDLSSPDFNPNNNGYNPGTSIIDFRVDHSNAETCNSWYFNYSIIGNIVDTLRVNVDNVDTEINTSLIEAITSNYVYFRFKVNNVPGSANQVQFNISDVTNSDCHCIDSTFIDHTVTHNILALPPIGSFDN